MKVYEMNFFSLLRIGMYFMEVSKSINYSISLTMYKTEISMIYNIYLYVCRMEKFVSSK